jgi:hypothetical protein
MVTKSTLGLCRVQIKRGARLRAKSLANLDAFLQHHICATSLSGTLASYRQQITNRATNWATTELQSLAVSNADLVTMTGTPLLTDDRRTLSTKEDTMSSCVRRPPRPLCKLYPPEERMQLLPRGTQPRRPAITNITGK